MSRPSTIPEGVRKIVLARADKFCEMCVQRHRLTLHHRQQRSVGGLHLVCNLLALCRPCHDRVHHEIKASHERGRLVQSWQYPADIPVLLSMGWVYLEESGMYRIAPEMSGTDLLRTDGSD